MTDKEKVDCLIELHRAKLDHFIQTRTIEFQVNIAIWTLIVVAGSFIFGKIHLSNCWHRYVFDFMAFIIILIHFFWMLLIQRSENYDHDCMNHYRNEITKLTAIKELDFKPRLTLWGWGWMILEVFMTIVLLIAVGILLSAKYDPKNTTSEVTCPCVTTHIKNSI